jgi:hypothetical protein
MSLVTLDMVRKRREFMCPLNRVVAIVMKHNGGAARAPGEVV